MKKYWKIWWRLMRMSLMADMQYTIDFWTGAITGVIFMAGQLAFLWLLFDQLDVGEIGGYSLWQLYFVYGIYYLVTGLVFMIFMASCWELESRINRGMLDLSLIKPINSFVATFFRKFIILTELPGQFLGLILIVYILWVGKIDIGGWQWLQIIFLAIQGTLLFGVMYMIGSFLSFFVMRFNALNEIMHNLDIICTYPRKLFSGKVGFVLTYIWPMLLIVTPIFNVLSLDMGFMDWFKLVGVNVVFVLLAIWMWREGLKRYQSAA